jgi:hypothetical protein
VAAVHRRLRRAAAARGRPVVAGAVVLAYDKLPQFLMDSSG